MIHTSFSIFFYLFLLSDSLGIPLHSIIHCLPTDINLDPPPLFIKPPVLDYFASVPRECFRLGYKWSMSTVQRSRDPPLTLHPAKATLHLTRLSRMTVKLLKLITAHTIPHPSSKPPFASFLNSEHQNSEPPNLNLTHHRPT